METTVGRIGTIVRNCIPKVVRKLTVYVKMVNILNIIIIEMTVNIDINTKSSDIISRRNFASYEFPNKKTYS